MNHDNTSLIACKALLQRVPQDKRALLYGYLPQEDREFLQELGPAQKDSLVEETMDEKIDRIHGSWFVPYLRTFPEGDMRYFLSAVSDAKASQLKKLLMLSNQLKPLNLLTTRFLQESLYRSAWEEGEPIPFPCLPETSLNILLKMEERRFSVLIDYLGLHDLSLEVRQIIDTSRLKQILQALPPEQEQYLKNLATHKEPVSFGKMGLERWKGDKESLLALIRQRGLNRLAKALYTPDRSLALHVSRKMESEQGSLLMRLCSDLENSKAYAQLREQVISLLHL